MGSGASRGHFLDRDLLPVKTVATGKSKNIRLDDLADSAGVSVSTVSRALSGSAAVNPQTRARIRALAEEAGYSAPVRRSRSVSQRTQPSVMILLPPPLGQDAPQIDPFTLSLLGGIFAEMRRRQLDLCVSHWVPQDQHSLTGFLDLNHSEGLIFLGQSQLHPLLNKLAREGRRFVVWGAMVPGQVYCSIGSDNFAGGMRATNHLIRLGRRRIAFIGQSEVIELAQRHEGYQAALSAANLEIDPALFRPCSLTPEAAAEAINDLVDHAVPFDALVCGSDLAAVGALRALARRGISIPGDVSVVGYDNIDIAAHTHPALTTVQQDTTKAGRLLVSKLMRILAGDQPSSERLTTNLIVRESCGA